MWCHGCCTFAQPSDSDMEVLFDRVLWIRHEGAFKWGAYRPLVWGMAVSVAVFMVSDVEHVANHLSEVTNCGA